MARNVLKASLSMPHLTFTIPAADRRYNVPVQHPNLPSMLSGAIIIGGCAALLKLIRRIEAANSDGTAFQSGGAVLAVTCTMFLGVLAVDRVAGRYVSSPPTVMGPGTAELAFDEFDLIEEELFGDFLDDFIGDGDPDYEPLSGLTALAVIV